MRIPTFLTTGRSGAVLPTLVLVGALLLVPGWGVQRCAAQSFPITPTDEQMFSIGVVQIVVDPSFAFLFAPAPTYAFYYPGYAGPASGILTGPVMYDGNTVIGESDVQVRPSSGSIVVGTPALYPSPAYANVQAYSDFALIPPPFTSTPAGYDEIFTQIKQMSLVGYVDTNGSSCSDPRVPSTHKDPTGQGGGPQVTVKAGPGGMGIGSSLPMNRRSIGIVQQTTGAGDFPAQSFFDVFVEVNLPRVPFTMSDTDFPATGAVLYNDASNPLLIENLSITNLPPEATYVHGQSTAVPIRFRDNHPPYWIAGDVLGYLTLAGHGVFTNVVTATAPCAAATAPGGLLDQTLGPIGSPIPPPPVPWLRPTNSFPTPTASYGSVVNTVVDSSGATNVLDDTVSFTVGTQVLYVRDLSLGNLGNSITPPPPNNSAPYSEANTVATMELSQDGLIWSPGQGTGPASVTISNTTPAGGTTSTFDTEMMSLDLAGNSPLVTTDPSLPVVYPDGVYRTPEEIHATFHGPGLVIVLTHIEHRPFAPVIRDNNGVDEFEQFDSALVGQISMNGDPFVPIQGTGPVQTKVFDKVGRETGFFHTEMLSMSLNVGLVMIRESPTLPSLGQTSITSLGGGLYRIDSFFDVFTELSMDGGQTWIPADGPVRVQAFDPQTGSFMLRESPTKQSLGKHTLRSDPRGHRVSSFFDVFLELSTDGGQTWTPANRAMRLLPSLPPAVPGTIFFRRSGNDAILQWQNEFTLQSTPNLRVPFTDVAGPITTGPYTNTMTGGAKFFRLRN